MRAIPERLRGVLNCSRQGAIQIHIYLTLPPHIGDRFLRVKWPNQQC